MRLYTYLRRFVDWDLATNWHESPLSLLALFLLGISALAANGSGDWRIRAGSLLLGAIILVWIIFVLWRGWRLFKRSALKGDRRYDRETRLELPPEYRDTESATKASRSRRNSGRRPR